MNLLEIACEHMGLSDTRFRRISSPARVLESSIYLQDDDITGPYTCFRIQHAPRAGVPVGDFAFAYASNMDKAEANASGISLALALAEVPASGAFGGILAEDDEDYSSSLHDIYSQIKDLFGPEKDLLHLSRTDLADSLLPYLTHQADVLGKSAAHGGISRAFAKAVASVEIIRQQRLRRFQELQGLNVSLLADDEDLVHLCEQFILAGAKISGLSNGIIAINTLTADPKPVVAEGMQKWFDANTEQNWLTQAEFYRMNSDLLIDFIGVDKSYLPLVNAKSVLAASNPLGHDYWEALASEGLDVLPHLPVVAAEQSCALMELEQNMLSEIWSRKQVVNRLTKQVGYSYQKAEDAAKRLGCTQVLAQFCAAVEALEIRLRICP